MLIHPWDAAVDDAEWRTWLADGHDFGQLVVNGLPGQPPTVVPTHFVVEETATGTQLLVHLARPNPVWAGIHADPEVLVTCDRRGGHWLARSQRGRSRAA